MLFVMGDFNARIGLGAEEHPSNGKRLLELVRAGDLNIGNQLLCWLVGLGEVGKVCNRRRVGKQ